MRPKQPSIAQKFLKQFDRIGDEIEAQARYRPSAIRKGTSVSASYGVETQAPSCGTEIVEPTCGMESYRPPTSQGMTKPMPLYQHESPSFQTDPPAAPIKKRSPATPMHPQASPEQQARGKIKDNPVMPSVPVRRQEPAKLQEPEPTNEVNPQEPQVQNRNTPVVTPEAPVALPQSVKEPFAPRLPHASSKPADRLISPSQNIPQSSPELPPQPGLPVGPTTPIGSPNLPQSQEEIPDVLVDPFRDDVSWRTRRDQMNGVLQTSGSVKERTEPAAAIATPMRLRAVPVQEIEETPKSVISIGPSFDPNGSFVVTSSYIESVPVRVHTVKRHVSETRDEMTPFVNRTSVPRKK
ncbi:MAG: hypothetical protein ACK56W_21910 [Pirellula sp.]|nr:hypothetical protein [Pirellula sp.]